MAEARYAAGCAWIEGEYVPIASARIPILDTGFNLFLVRDGRLSTPASGVLEGITRRTVIELAEQQGLLVSLTTLRAEDVRAADELFLTSTAGGVMPVTTLDGHPVGNGRPGPITTRLRDAYWAAHEAGPWVTEVAYGGQG